MSAENAIAGFNSLQKSFNDIGEARIKRKKAEQEQMGREELANNFANVENATLDSADRKAIIDATRSGALEPKEAIKMMMERGMGADQFLSLAALKSVQEPSPENAKLALAVTRFEDLRARAAKRMSDARARAEGGSGTSGGIKFQLTTKKLSPGEIGGLLDQKALNELSGEFVNVKDVKDIGNVGDLVNQIATLESKSTDDPKEYLRNTSTAKVIRDKAATIIAQKLYDKNKGAIDMEDAQATAREFLDGAVRQGLDENGYGKFLKSSYRFVLPVVDFSPGKTMPPSLPRPEQKQDTFGLEPDEAQAIKGETDDSLLNFVTGDASQLPEGYVKFAQKELINRIGLKKFREVTGGSGKKKGILSSLNPFSGSED